MRIIVVEPLGKGGLIHYSYHMCRALQRGGADVTLITSTHYELENLAHEFRLDRRLHLWDARQSGEMPALQRKLRRAWRGVRYVTEWLRLVRHLRHEKPDLVLLGEIRFWFEVYFLRLLRAGGLRLADVVHDVRSYDTGRDSSAIVNESPQHLARYDRIYHLFDALFVHDKINRDLFLKLYTVPAERVHEIPHGANEIMLEMTPATTPEALRQRLGLPSDEPLLLFFGTVTKYKGVEDLIRAFPLVRQQAKAHLLVAGFPAKDIDPQALHILADLGGVKEHITWWLDYVPSDEITALLALADLVVLPYRAITQSGVISVAYACGKPVVATRVGGLNEVVEEGRSGYLAAPENPESLAQAIVKALEDPTRLNAMGSHARELAESRYSWRRVAEIVLGAVQRL